MKLARRDPFDLEQAWPTMGRWFRRWPELFGDWEWTEEDMLTVEEYTEDGTLVIRTEIPGIDPEKDVDIEISEGRLHIKAERRREETEEKRNYYRSELSYGALARSLSLPAGAKEEEIQASYKDGILEVRVPLAAEAEKAGKKIAVEHA